MHIWYMFSSLHPQPFVTCMRPWTRPHQACHPSFCCSSFTWPFHSLLRRGTRDNTSSRSEPSHHSYITKIDTAMPCISYLHSYQVLGRVLTSWHCVSFLSGCQRVLAADDESASAEAGVTRARDSHGGKTLILYDDSMCGWWACWEAINNPFQFCISVQIYRLTLRVELPLPLQRRTSSTNILV